MTAFEFEVYFGSVWMGTVRASDADEALLQALRRYGQHLVGILTVRQRTSRVS